MEGKRGKIEKISEKLVDIGFIIYISSLVISKAGLNVGLAFIVLGFLTDFKRNIGRIKEMSLEYKVVISFLLIYSFYDLVTPGFIKSFSIEIGELYRILPLMIVPLYKKKYSVIKKYVEIMIAFFSLAVVYNLFDYDVSKMERLNGFLYSTTTGHISAMILVFIFGMFINEKNKIKKIYYLLIEILGVYMLFLTATRAAILGYFLACVLLSILKYKKKSVIIIIFMIIFSLMMINKVSYLSNFKLSDIKKEVSLNTRLTMWRVSLKYFTDESFLYLGLGRDTLTEVFEKEREIHPETLIEKKYAGNPHNTYVTILSEKGVYIFISFISIFVAYLLKSTSLLRGNELFYSLIGSQIVYFISGLTEDNWRSLLMRAPYFVVLIFLFLLKNNSKGLKTRDEEVMEKIIANKKK